MEKKVGGSWILVLGYWLLVLGWWLVVFFWGRQWLGGLMGAKMRKRLGA